jgi:crotonobetainyl-CoA:carnitine CoA-transferase CaiB-like acyl-CoA transferase
VLDFSHVLAGPYCTLLLADFGASVFKLESASGGDMGRGWGPPFAGNQSSFCLGLNRGKQGISIDLKRPQGLDLCLRLIDQMDELVENFRPARWIASDLATPPWRSATRDWSCSISRYGQAGPSRDEAAMDLVVECSSGFMSITGTEEGELVPSSSRASKASLPLPACSCSPSCISSASITMTVAAVAFGVIPL